MAVRDTGKSTQILTTAAFASQGTIPDVEESEREADRNLGWDGRDTAGWRVARGMQKR